MADLVMSIESLCLNTVGIMERQKEGHLSFLECCDFLYRLRFLPTKKIWLPKNPQKSLLQEWVLKLLTFFKRNLFY